MSRVITAADVEAAARGDKSLSVEGGAIVTPLARDRASVLGVRVLEGVSPPGEKTAPHSSSLVLESKVRVAARRALLRSGRGLGELEDVVAQVMRRLGGGTCDCGCK
jgi:hypothetical protein